MKSENMKNFWNKIEKTIITLFCFIIISCSNIEKYITEKKEQRTKQFFNQWYAESKQILEKNKIKGELQKDINSILNLFLSKDKNSKLKHRFPKLEYQILEESIKISIYKELKQTPNDKELIFSEVCFKHSLFYDDFGTKTLIITPKYRKILQKKLPYGFTDQTEKQNKDAKATLIKIGKGFKYDIPAKIHILFNKELNSAIVYRYRKGSFGKPFWFRYNKENKQWKYDGIKFNITIP